MNRLLLPLCPHKRLVFLMHPQLLDKGYVLDAHQEYLQNDVRRLTRLQLVIGEQLLMSLVFS